MWKNCGGHIEIASPRDDVCATCERIRKEITDAVTEPEKIAAAEIYIVILVMQIFILLFILLYCV